MKLSLLANVEGARRRKMRVGCGVGSGKGKTCGRGHKGQYARSGHKHKQGFEGGQMRLIRRIPKRGFKPVDATSYLPVNIGSLSVFPENSEVTPGMLQSAGLAQGNRGIVKILGAGDLSKKLVVKAHAFSASAKEKIEAAGGVCQVISAGKSAH